MQVKSGGLNLFHGSFAAPSPLSKSRKFQLLAQAAVPSRTQVFLPFFGLNFMSNSFIFDCTVLVGDFGIEFTGLL